MKDYTAVSMRLYKYGVLSLWITLCTLTILDRLACDGKHTMLLKPCLWTPACTLSAAIALASCSCVMVPGLLGESGADDPEDKTWPLPPSNCFAGAGWRGVLLYDKT